VGHGRKPFGKFEFSAIELHQSDASVGDLGIQRGKSYSWSDGGRVAMLEIGMLLVFLGGYEHTRALNITSQKDKSVSLRLAVRQLFLYLAQWLRSHVITFSSQCSPLR
jgi:hypothetical protein